MPLPGADDAVRADLHDAVPELALPLVGVRR